MSNRTPKAWRILGDLLVHIGRPKKSYVSDGQLVAAAGAAAATVGWMHSPAGSEDKQANSMALSSDLFVPELPLEVQEERLPLLVTLPGNTLTDPSRGCL